MPTDALHAINPVAIGDAKGARRNGSYPRGVRAGYGILIALAAAFCLIARSVASQSDAPDITLADRQLTIRSGAYGVVVPVTGITAVQLVHRLSGIGPKRNAFQFGTVYHGRFAMAPYGDALLFVDAMTPPYVMVQSAAGVVLFGLRDSARTMGLFAALSAQAGSR